MSLLSIVNGPAKISVFSSKYKGTNEYLIDNFSGKMSTAFLTGSTDIRRTMDGRSIDSFLFNLLNTFEKRFTVSRNFYIFPFAIEFQFDKRSNNYFMNRNKQR